MATKKNTKKTEGEEAVTEIVALEAKLREIRFGGAGAKKQNVGPLKKKIAQLYTAQRAATLAKK